MHNFLFPVCRPSSLSPRIIATKTNCHCAGSYCTCMTVGWYVLLLLEATFISEVLWGMSKHSPRLGASPGPHRTGSWLCFFFIFWAWASQAAGVAASKVLSFGPVICSSNGKIGNTRKLALKWKWKQEHSVWGCLKVWVPFKGGQHVQVHHQRFAVAAKVQSGSCFFFHISLQTLFNSNWTEIYRRRRRPLDKCKHEYLHTETHTCTVSFVVCFFKCLAGTSLYFCHFSPHMITFKI